MRFPPAKENVKLSTYGVFVQVSLEVVALSNVGDLGENNGLSQSPDEFQNLLLFSQESLVSCETRRNNEIIFKLWNSRK